MTPVLCILHLGGLWFNSASTLCKIWTITGQRFSFAARVAINKMAFEGNIRHKSGPLKQQNKTHKHGRHRSKSEIDKNNKGIFLCELYQDICGRVTIVDN